MILMILFSEIIIDCLNVVQYTLFQRNPCQWFHSILIFHQTSIHTQYSNKHFTNDDSTLPFFLSSCSLTISLERSSLGLLSSDGSGTNAQLALSLQSHDTATPLLVLGVLGGEALLQRVQRRLVLRVHSRQTHASSGLLVHQSAQTALAAHDRVRNAHLVAQSGQPHHQLQGIHVVGNQNQLGLLALHQLRHVVQTVLHNQSTLLLHGLALSLRLGSSLQTSLLLGLRLRSVLVHQTEHLSSLVLVQHMAELVHGGRNLQTLAQNLTLSLDDHVTRLFQESGEILLRL